MPRPYTVDSSY